jgi:hypothetical protein
VPCSFFQKLSSLLLSWSPFRFSAHRPSASAPVDGHVSRSQCYITSRIITHFADPFYTLSRVHLSAVWIGAALLSTEIPHLFHDFLYTLSAGFSHLFPLMAYKSSCRMYTLLPVPLTSVNQGSPTLFPPLAYKSLSQGLPASFLILPVPLTSLTRVHLHGIPLTLLLTSCTQSLPASWATSSSTHCYYTLVCTGSVWSLFG